MSNQFKQDLFDKCLSTSGNFSEFNNDCDHYFIEPILEGNPDRRMRFNGEEMIVWAINDYLGLANNKELIATAAASAARYGMSAPMGARKLTGTTIQHLTLEKELADFLQKPKGGLSNYGYLGVIGAINAVVKAGDAIIIDSLSHSCMIDGAFLAQARQHAKVYPFKHNDMNDLERQLDAAATDCDGGALIVTEGVFGMRGDLAKLNEICELKKQFNARLFLDDAHGFGVLGPNGRGTAEHLGCHEEVDLYFGTFAKAFVGIGAILAGEEEIISHISFNSRTDLSSKSLPLAMVETLLKTLQLVKDNRFRQKMWHNAKKLQQGLLELGFKLASTESPITAVVFTDKQYNLELGKKVLQALRDEYHIFTIAVTYPIVPKGMIVFRLIPTANHTDEDIDTTLNAFAELNQRFQLT
ncbi:MULTISPECIES: pyridoxal phosphate-dependent aminotransferase family protein [unclassified Legionella]|uniref:aminotransferase class I/II-fold pyridoxal phosphate-dependent enzyme n=1 Tax=unclassified Legionella TaxID=2622702 RepID=UPI0010542230|nr:MULTISPECIES: pyridoxal phosphate-dependent aminotransferase family protein [unclassified Legionella]MDI9818025.1 pyridoxal phosphate-dependent aminotransferase family protein [Legionella sp. PL877]